MNRTCRAKRENERMNAQSGACESHQGSEPRRESQGSEPKGLSDMCGLMTPVKMEEVTHIGASGQLLGRIGQLQREPRNGLRRPRMAQQRRVHQHGLDGAGVILNAPQGVEQLARGGGGKGGPHACEHPQIGLLLAVGAPQQDRWAPGH